MAMVEIACFHCGTKLNFSDRIGLREECDHCHRDVHVCRNCEFYDLGSYNECKESSAEVVREKERSNYCDYFAPYKGERSATGSPDSDLRDAAEALFKK